MRIDTGQVFALIAVLIVAGSAVAVMTGPAAGRTDDGIGVDADVPDEYSFEPPQSSGSATVGDQEFDSLSAAISAANPGDTIVLRGRFDESVTVETRDLTLKSAPGTMALVDGGGMGDVLTINADGVTVKRVWVRNSGYKASDNDAGIWINGSGTKVLDSRVTDITFGVWIDGVSDVHIANSTIVGREAVRPISYRGNGIQIWKVEDSVIENNRITDVRDGIYYSWAEDVIALNNTMWDLRYGVHYMYSDDCTLRGNLAFDNDVGYALMVSKRLVIQDNIAVNNSGQSGHGILVKSIDETTIRNNSLVANDKGMYVYNSLDNEITGNLVLENKVGIHLAAGSVREHVVGNSFINNDRTVLAVVSEQVTWNASNQGNYWSGARTLDLDNDGLSEVRHRPAGLIQHLVYENPQAGVFADSPAFDAIRLAESSFPVVEAPGVVDYYPLTTPAHDDWRKYYVRT